VAVVAVLVLKAIETKDMEAVVVVRCPTVHSR
jgi:hypothetical protein